MKLLRVLIGVVCVVVVFVGAALVALEFAPPVWLARQASAIASDRTGVPVNMERLSVRVFSRRPGLAVAGLDIGAESSALVSHLDARGSVALWPLLSGTVRFGDVAASGGFVNLVVDGDGRGNWQDLLPADGNGDIDDAPTDGESFAVPAIESIAIEGAVIEWQDRLRDVVATLSVDVSGSTTDPSRPIRLLVSGDADTGSGAAPLSVDASFAALSTRADKGGDEALRNLDVDVTARVGDTEATAVGTFGDVLTMDAVDLEITLKTDTLDAVRALAGIELPKIPRFELNGSLARDGTTLVLRRFDATLGDSVFEGDIRLDPATVPLTLFANLIFTALDLDEVLAIAFGDGVETSDADEKDKSVVSSGGGWFPDRTLDLAAVARTFNGAVDIEARGIDSRFPLDEVNVRVAIDGQAIEVAPLRLGIGGGSVEGSIALDVVPVPAEGVVELQIRQLRLKKMLDSLGIDDDSSGTFGGRAKFWIRGDSIESFATNADGGLFLLMTGGQLDALLAEVSGIDLVESILLLLDPGKQLTTIDCAYADVLVEKGVVDISDFIVDTTDTVFIADGSVDLGEQTYSVSIEPHPKDASLLAAQTSVTVEDDGDGMSVLPGPEIATRVAAAALLAPIATPAAALLPFIQPGNDVDSPYCNGLVGSLEEAR